MLKFLLGIILGFIIGIHYNKEIDFSIKFNADDEEDN